VKVPVRKFRSVESMPSALLEDHPSTTTIARIRALWLRAWRFSPQRYPRGVFRFRSLTEAQRARSRPLP
jgi:hypothetical protein